MAKLKDLSTPEITPEKEKYYREIFNKLDFDSDGRIDVDDLKNAFSANDYPHVPGQAESFINAGDRDSDGIIDVTDFIKYLHEHELKLRLMFKHFDRNQDGEICKRELKEALQSVGIELTDKQASNYIKRWDNNNSSSIDLDEWIEVQLLYPSTNLKDILSYWKHETYLDSGESLLVPDDYSEEDRRSGLVFRRLICGATAGAVSRTCTAPLDRLKVMMQVHASKANGMGVVSTYKAVVTEGGIRAFWRGNGINVLKIAPETAIKFMAFEHMKQILKNNRKQETGACDRFVAGAIAGVVSQTSIYPLEVVKTRLAIRKTGQYNGILHCAKSLYKREGIRCFFKGYVPNLIGIIPYAGIDLCVYETFKNQYLKRAELKEPSSLLIIASGCLSTTCGQLASYPFALVRTKMQATDNEHRRKRGGMFSLFKSIFQSEGIFGLYRGLGPNFMKVAPAVSISYLVYEKMRLQLGVYK